LSGGLERNPSVQQEAGHLPLGEKNSINIYWISFPPLGETQRGYQLMQEKNERG
jgi:hypothetical protein